jgi:hypothetical protein
MTLIHSDLPTWANCVKHGILLKRSGRAISMIYRAPVFGAWRVSHGKPNHKTIDQIVRIRRTLGYVVSGAPSMAAERQARLDSQGGPRLVSRGEDSPIVAASPNK